MFYFLLSLLISGSTYLAHLQADAELRKQSKEYYRITVDNTLKTLGSTHVGGDLRVAGNESIAGNLTVGDAGNLTVNGDGLFTGNLFVGGSEFIGGNLTVDGNTSIIGDLTVLGIINSNQVMTSTATTLPFLQVTGDASIGGALQVTSTASLSTLTTSSWVIIGGNLTINGALTASNFPDSYVTGPASANDNAVARFNGTTGKLIQNSAIQISDFSASPQANVAILADNGSTTNIDLVLVPKGTGALTLNIPDGSTTNGNARGSNAIDLQISRASNTAVAGGNQSVLVGGDSNSITPAGIEGAIIGGGGHSISGALATIAGGSSNQATNQYIFIGGGEESSASGIAAVCLGGIQNNASGNDSICLGGANNIASNESCITGGNHNTAAGLAAIALGSQSYALNDNSFVWTDNSTTFTSKGSQTFNICATGGSNFVGNFDVSDTSGNPVLFAQAVLFNPQVGIGAAPVTQTLEVNGATLIDGNVQYNSDSGVTLNLIGNQASTGLKIIRGTVNTATSGILRGEGFTFTTQSPVILGAGTITFTDPFSSAPTILMSTETTLFGTFVDVIGTPEANLFGLQVLNFGNVPADSIVDFIAIGI